MAYSADPDETQTHLVSGTTLFVNVPVSFICITALILIPQKVSEYDQELPQLHTVAQPTAP